MPGFLDNLFSEAIAAGQGVLQGRAIADEINRQHEIEDRELALLEQLRERQQAAVDFDIAEAQAEAQRRAQERAEAEQAALEAAEDQETRENVLIERGVTPQEARVIAKDPISTRQVLGEFLEGDFAPIEIPERDLDAEAVDARLEALQPQIQDGSLTVGEARAIAADPIAFRQIQNPKVTTDATFFRQNTLQASRMIAALGPPNEGIGGLTPEQHRQQVALILEAHGFRSLEQLQHAIRTQQIGDSELAAQELGLAQNDVGVFQAPTNGPGPGAEPIDAALLESLGDVLGPERRARLGGGSG